MGSTAGAAGSHPVVYTVTRDVRAPVGRLFDEIVAEDVLPKVLHRHGVLPAVVGTEAVTASWNGSGSQRRVLTSDGRTLREEVTDWQRPRHFAYRVDGFTGIMGFLVTSAVGDWTFSGDNSVSAFSWTYTFFARSRAVVPAVAAFVRLMWSGYMAGCADRCVALAETNG